MIKLIVVRGHERSLQQSDEFRPMSRVNVAIMSDLKPKIASLSFARILNKVDR